MPQIRFPASASAPAAPARTVASRLLALSAAAAAVGVLPAPPPAADPASSSGALVLFLLCLKALETDGTCADPSPAWAACPARRPRLCGRSHRPAPPLSCWPVRLPLFSPRCLTRLPFPCPHASPGPQSRAGEGRGWARLELGTGCGRLGRGILSHSRRQTGRVWSSVSEAEGLLCLGPGKPPERPPSARPRGDAEGTMPNSQVGSGRAGVCAAGTAGRVCSALCRDARASPRGAGAFPVRGASAAVSPASPGGACERLGAACRQRRASAPRPPAPASRSVVQSRRLRRCRVVSARAWCLHVGAAGFPVRRGCAADTKVRSSSNVFCVSCLFKILTFRTSLVVSCLGPSATLP